MAKRTAVIDIGSNSITSVVYEKSSRYAFSLIKKSRASIKIGEGAYEHDGVLQSEAMDRAYYALEDMVNIAKALKCTKILTAATSALRDAPNKKEFLDRVKDGLNLSLKVIDGDKEAYLGGIAAMNLLFDLGEFTTVDIGGGSTEFAHVKDGKVLRVYSLDIGTVRLKELFFDKQADSKEIKSFIQHELERLPNDFKLGTIVGIGGTIRAISASVMQKEDYPLDSLHGYEYRVKDFKKLIKAIPSMSDKELKKLDISPNRFDTIREGATIFYSVIKKLNAKSVISSKAGVREGLYLTDLLRGSRHRFPHNFNVSIKSIIDRFALNNKNCAYVRRLSSELFEILKPYHNIDDRYKRLLGYAATLSPIGTSFNIYSNSGNSFYLFLEYLNFSFRHEEKLLIALLLKLSAKEKKRKSDYKKYKLLLPDFDTMEWLYFIFSLSRSLNENRKIQKIDLKVEDDILYIRQENPSYLARESIEKLKAPLKISYLD